MLYFYIKECLCCNATYYKKEISEEQFTVLEDNPHIACRYEETSYDAVIGSCCSECASDL
jgi:hypothetical protein